MLYPFQSSPGPKAGRNRMTYTSCLGRPLFQSSPGPKAGRNVSIEFGLCELCLVSILARPEGRAQPRSIENPEVGGILFQSSPGPKAGRNTPILTLPETQYWVSILARPEGRAQHIERAALGAPHRVSILARPEGRAQLAGPAALAVNSCLFQSSPGPKAGRN